MNWLSSDPNDAPAVEPPDFQWTKELWINSMYSDLVNLEIIGTFKPYIIDLVHLWAYLQSALNAYHSSKFDFYTIIEPYC